LATIGTNFQGWFQNHILLKIFQLEGFKRVLLRFCIFLEWLAHCIVAAKQGAHEIPF
jgi:hypothetical protein